MPPPRHLYTALRWIWLASIGALALTLALPDWLEALGLEPDAGNGAAEAGIALGLAVVAVLGGATVWVARGRREAAGHE